MSERFRVEVLHTASGYDAVVLDANGNRAAINCPCKTERSALKAAANLIRRLVAASDYAAKENK